MEQFWKELTIGATILIAGLLKVIYDLTVMMPKKNIELYKAKTDTQNLELEIKINNTTDNKLNKFKDKLLNLIKEEMKSFKEDIRADLQKEKEHMMKNLKHTHFLLEQNFERELRQKLKHKDND